MLPMTYRHLAYVLGFASIVYTPCVLAQQTVLPLWPHATPEPPQTTEPEMNNAKPVPGQAKLPIRMTNVTKPTIAVYPPHGKNSGTAALVFPGGGYSRLAMDIEGTDTCDWLNSVGITCLLVKYRVPQPPGEAGHYPADPSDLEDAQQAMRIARLHASEWHFDPNRIGVVGFSAGGNLAVLLSTHPDDKHVESTPAAPDVSASTDARANFAVVVYPAYLAMPPEETSLFPAYTPNSFTPDTFLIQAENDRTYGRNALVYYRALMDAHIPAQLHYYATGGHGFGTFPVNKPEDHWTELATTWLRAIGMLPPFKDVGPASGEPSPTPCTAQNIPTQPPLPGRPSPAPRSNDPNCPNPNP
jgi:acetyl esterase/lipase